MENRLFGKTPKKKKHKTDTRFSPKLLNIFSEKSQYTIQRVNC